MKSSNDKNKSIPGNHSSPEVSNSLSEESSSEWLFAKTKEQIITITNVFRTF